MLSRQSEAEVLALLQRSVEDGDELTYRAIIEAPAVYRPADTEAASGPGQRGAASRSDETRVPTPTS